jgi:hypothetical protein
VGAKRYNNTGTIMIPPPIPNNPAINPEKAPRSKSSGNISFISSKNQQHLGKKFNLF